jgi:hypothetical protein
MPSEPQNKQVVPHQFEVKKEAERKSKGMVSNLLRLQVRAITTSSSR